MGGWREGGREGGRDKIARSLEYLNIAGLSGNWAFLQKGNSFNRTYSSFELDLSWDPGNLDLDFSALGSWGSWTLFCFVVSA